MPDRLFLRVWGHCYNPLTLRIDPSIHFQVRVEGPLDFAVIDMILDTGATLVTIPTSVANDLGYSLYQPEDMQYLTTPSGIVHAPINTLISVEVLGVVATGIRAACIDMPGSMTFAGLLGLSFLRNFDVDLHFRSGVIRFNS